MCDNPRKFIDRGGRERVAGCRQCKKCTEARVRDWIGRIGAEARYSAGATFMTLTYGTDRRVNGARDKPGATVLTYSHIQKWLKKIRGNKRSGGYQIRYFLAGEQGSMKGRCHWHVLLFWQPNVDANGNRRKDASGQELPDMPPKPLHKVRWQDGKAHEICWDDPFWEHGHSQWAEVNASTARYVCKYVVKGSDKTKDDHASKERKQSIVRMSRFPLLGAKHFDEVARQHVEQMLPIKDRLYTVPGAIDPKTGKHWRYRMGDASVRYLSESFERQWKARHPGIHPPHSPVFERFEDERAVVRAGFAITPRKMRASRPFVAPPLGFVVRFHEGVNEYVAQRGPDKLFWSYDENGRRAWARKIIGERQAEQRRKAEAATAGPPEYRLGRPPKRETAQARKQRQDREAYHAAMTRNGTPVTGNGGGQ